MCTAFLICSSTAGSLSLPPQNRSLFLPQHICFCDYASHLKSASLILFYPLTSFQLPRTPIADLKRSMSKKIMWKVLPSVFFSRVTQFKQECRALKSEITKWASRENAGLYDIIMINITQNRLLILSLSLCLSLHLSHRHPHRKDRQRFHRRLSSPPSLQTGNGHI